MTKKELLKKLEIWPDETEIEIEIRKGIVGNKGPIWLDTVDIDHDDDDEHLKYCLLIAGKVLE